MLCCFMILLILLYKRVSPSEDDRYELSYALYGNLSTMDDIFLEELSSSSSSEEDDAPRKPTTKRPRPQSWFKKINIDSIKEIEYDDTGRNQTLYDHDLREFNDITREVKNVTRRAWIEVNYMDYQERYADLGLTIENEFIKKKKMIAVNLQFLIHTRYKVVSALKQKDLWRNSKRYRLGYLFNKLRILNNHQFKFVHMIYIEDETYYSNLTTLIMNYERVVRLDIDIRDTIDYIKDINKEK